MVVDKASFGTTTEQCGRSWSAVQSSARALSKKFFLKFLKNITENRVIYVRTPHVL